MDLPKTGDAALDFASEAGPRVISPDTPDHVIEEIGKSRFFSPLRDAMRKMKLEDRRIIDLEIQAATQKAKFYASLPNRRTPFDPDAFIPMRLVYELEAQEKHSWNPAMREDTLRCYPQLTVEYWRHH